MRFFSVVVLTVATFLVSAGSSSVTISSQITQADFPAYGQFLNQKDVVPKRLLRTYESTGNDIEDRGNFVTDAIALAKLKSLTSKLGINVEEALKSSQLKKIWKYVDKLNKGKIPSKHMSVTGNLMKKYGQNAVMTGIVNAKKSTRTKDVVTRLETDLVLNYVSVFEGAKYIEEIGRALTKFFGSDRNVLSMIAVAKKEPQAIHKAKELNDLETTVLVQYLERRLTKLNVRTSSMIDGQYLNELEKAFLKLSTQFPDNDVSLLRALIGKYGDRAVAKGLAEAKVIGNSKEVASNMLSQQFEMWFTDKKSVNTVFKLLNLDKYTHAGFVTSSGLDVLEGYIKLVNSKTSADISFIGIMATHFHGEEKWRSILPRHGWIDGWDLQRKS